MGRIGKVSTFVPQKRFALLVNRWDTPELFSPPYSRLIAYSRGNNSVYQMEAALQRGKLDLKREIEHAYLRFGAKEVAEQAGELVAQAREMYAKDPDNGFHLVDKAGLSEAAVAACLQAYAIQSMAGARYFQTGSSIRYDELRKVFPDAADLKADVFEILSFYQGLAKKDSLTLFFIRAHGEKGTIAEFSYAELLDRLDKIKGKKAFISIGCFSGSLVREIKQRPKGDDYVVLSSTSAAQQGTNWSEDEVLTDLHSLIRADKPLSRFKRRAHTNNDTTQTPRLHLPFDVIL